MSRPVVQQFIGVRRADVFTSVKCNGVTTGPDRKLRQCFQDGPLLDMDREVRPFRKRDKVVRHEPFVQLPFSNELGRASDDQPFQYVLDCVGIEQLRRRVVGRRGLDFRVAGIFAL